MLWNITRSPILYHKHNLFKKNARICVFHLDHIRCKNIFRHFLFKYFPWVEKMVSCSESNPSSTHVTSIHVCSHTLTQAWVLSREARAAVPVNTTNISSMLTSMLKAFKANSSSLTKLTIIQLSWWLWIKIFSKSVPYAQLLVLDAQAIYSQYEIPFSATSFLCLHWASYWLVCNINLLIIPFPEAKTKYPLLIFPLSNIK